MANNNILSALLALFIALVFVVLGQLFKPLLAATREGNLVAGVLGALCFTFTLTAISNVKMASAGPNAKSGLFEAGIALIVAIIASAAIHRIAITLCLLFSGVFLFFLAGISQKRYGSAPYGTHPGNAAAYGVESKKKK